MQTKEKGISEKVIVRRIKTKDFTRLSEILKTAFQREIEMVGLDSGRLMSFKKYHVIIEVFYHIFDFFYKDYPTILVATLEDKVVGEVHLVPRGKRIWTIDSLAVDLNYSGRGIGYNLIKGAVEYITKKRGKKALSSIRTDNVPALKIAEKLGFSPFQKTSLFFHEIKNPLSTSFHPDVSIRKFHPADVEEVFEVCEVADPTKTNVFNLCPKDFLSSTFEWIINRMLQLHSEKLVVEFEGKIVGYAYVTYTTQREAAKIESLCVLPNQDLLRLTEALLTHISNTLAEKNITKVTVSLDGKREETIEAIKQKGFRRLASFYEITRKLD